MALWANGNMVAYEPDMQPKLNGAGREVIPMSDEQKCELQSCSSSAQLHRTRKVSVLRRS